MRDLVRQTLRMRPDRIVVGEVRGAEVIDLLTALNTGHEGGCATVHANSAADVPARIEALGLAAGLDRAAVHALLGAGLDAVVHLDRDAQGRRQLQGIHVVQINEQHQVELIPAVVREGREFIEQQGIRKLRMQTVKAPIRDLRATS
jgi:pilus assembly protein CpaF